jgi:hypothetical protein
MNYFSLTCQYSAINFYQHGMQSGNSSPYHHGFTPLVSDFYNMALMKATGDK